MFKKLHYNVIDNTEFHSYIPIIFLKHLNFATDYRCLADTGNIFQNKVVLLKNEEEFTLEECTAGWLIFSLSETRV